MNTTSDDSTGRLAFLFSDIVDSTSIWEQHGAAMAASLRVHDRVMRRCLERRDGTIFSHPGDGFGVAFRQDGDAIGAALESTTSSASS